jgi:hypothetical protein
MASKNQLDHTVINVKAAMPLAAATFKALGFTLTPQGRHSLGSINHLMMFGTDYMELLGIPEGEPHQRPDLASAPTGINGIVFKTGNVDDVFAHLQANGMAGDPPRAFTRPVDLGDSKPEASFRTVTVRADVFPGGRVYYCEHGTPELVWRPEWQSHANRVVKMPEFVTVSENAGEEVAKFATLLGGEAAGGSVTFDGGKVSVLSPDQYRARYGDLASAMSGRPAIFGAMVCACDDMGPIKKILASPPEGVRAQTGANGIVARVDALDSVLEFVPA